MPRPIPLYEDLAAWDHLAPHPLEYVRCVACGRTMRRLGMVLAAHGRMHIRRGEARAGVWAQYRPTAEPPYVCLVPPLSRP